MKKIKNFFNKKFKNIPKKIALQTTEEDNNIDNICRFKLLYNHKTGRYEKVLIYKLEDLKEEDE